MGVTGARDQVGPAAEQLVQRTRSVTSLPVCVGLGVSSGEQAEQIAKFADGVIVGSAFVRLMLDADSPSTAASRVRALAEELRAGIDRAAAAAEGRVE
jgi:tryptophan synthase alpha chain